MSPSEKKKKKKYSVLKEWSFCSKKKKKRTELGPLGLGRGGGTNFKWALETLDPNT